MVQVGEHVFYSAEEVAVAFGVTYRTLQRWMREEKARPKSIPDWDQIMVTAPSGRKMFKGEEIHRILGVSYGIRVDAATVSQMLEQSEQHSLRRRHSHHDVSRSMSMA
jgi:predicted site-specific integrase-resolvase